MHGYSRLLASITLTAGLVPLAHAKPLTVYQGTLAGAGEIVMELDSAPGKDGSLSGRYFYPKNGVDIPLKGTAADLIEPSPQPASKPAASWRGTLDQDGYHGKWVDAATGKERAFTLKRVAHYDSGKNYPAIPEHVDSASQPYELRKLAGHAKASGEAIGNATVAYQMFVDPRTKLAYPRLARHPQAGIMTRVNQMLEQNHWRLNLAALECKSAIYQSNNPGAGTLGGYEDEEIKVTWLSPAVLSFTQKGSIDCGGAYPYNHFDVRNYDLLRGEALNWDKVFGNKLQELVGSVKQSLAKREEAGELEDSSKAGCADLWPQHLALGLAQPGELSLSVSEVPHAAGICLGTLASLPLAELKPYLKPGGEAYLVKP